MKVHDDRITVFIADDHPLFRRGLREVIDSDGEFSVIGEAGDGEEALQRIGSELPRIAVLDIAMPKLSGLDVAEQIRALKMPIAVVVLTMYDDEALFQRAMDAGVTGFILKDGAVGDILLALKAVAKGEYYITQTMMSGTMKRMMGTAGERDASLSLLTALERNIVRMIADNKTSEEIAHRLFVSRKTIENHRATICTKLGLSGSYALLRFALRNSDHMN
jgi:DNA-binding NarL/FixJ family response regulator